MVEKHDKKFYLSNGNSFSNLKSFAKHLKTMGKDVYHTHVNKDKNDFSNWTNFSMKNVKLGKAIEGQITKLEMELEILRHLIHDANTEKKSSNTQLKSKK